MTARINMQLFTEARPYGPEDPRDDTAPVLVEAFPATVRSVARVGARLPFSHWFWS